MAEESVPSTTTRVERSFAFIDLSGFTAFTDSEGDDRAVAVLASFRSIVREVASARGVRIAKWLGDGAMLVCVEREPLMAAVVDIVRRISETDLLPLRAGVTAGPVILIDGDDYIGTAVNMASRLCDEANPNEVLAAARAVPDVLVDIRVEPRGRRDIRGLGEPVEVVRLTAVD